MLTIKELDVSYGELQVLFDVNLELNSGEIVSVVGSNSAGKTTLIRTISGLIKPTRGGIVYHNNGIKEVISDMSADAIVSRGIIQVPEGRLLWANMSVKDNLKLGSYTKEARKLYKDSMEFVLNLFPRLKERFNQKAGTLSGGEQQMLAIGRALFSNPKVLMFDEPSLGLAPKLVDLVFDIIKQINESGISILIVEQNVYEALELSNRCYVIENGRVITCGQSKTLINDEAIKRSYLGVV